MAKQKLFPYDPNSRQKEVNRLNKAANAAVKAATADTMQNDVVETDEQDSWKDFADWANSGPWGSASLALQYTNAHVAICVSVLADAVSQLPVDIIRVETSDGSRTEIDDNAHPANFMFKGPNPDLTWADFTQGIVTSLLLDGNTYITIRKVPGGTYHLFLLDPSKMRIIYSKDKSYIIAYEYGYGTEKQTFMRDEMIHMREFDVRTPLDGTSRLEALYNELQMDEYIKEFNTNFFKNGATVGSMFIPEKILNKEHFKQIRNIIRNDINGSKNAFKLFVNKFPGKLEFPRQTHKDISFLELLKYIRETINGVFKVPPYKAGILEYANYANSTQQQESFWTDGVIPLLRRIQDIVNKDFINKYFDEDHELKFNTKGVAALQGDPEQRMKILVGYKREGILTVDECRADIDREPLNEEASQASAEEDKYTKVYHSLFNQQKVRIHQKLDDVCSGGNFMTNLLVTPAEDIFDVHSENQMLGEVIRPLLRETMRTVGDIVFNSLDTSDAFNMDSDACDVSYKTVILKHEIINEKSFNGITNLLNDSITFNWALKELKDRIDSLLTYKYAQHCAKEIVPTIVGRIQRAALQQKEESIYEG